MESKRRIVKYKGELDLAGFKLPCYVLQDGTRLLSTRGMQNALKMTDENSEKSSGSRLGENLGQKSLKPFVNAAKGVGDFSPIICYTESGVEIHGYKATLLPDICNIYLEARRNIHLAPRQTVIADQCEILMSSFAKVGIIALVDEATGYQYDREKEELQKQLQKILGVYVLDEPEKWQKMFPWTFYKHLFRLWGQPFTVEVMTKPSFIGILTNKYVYRNLPKGVLEELKGKTPKSKKGNWSHKLHQLLTTEIGREDLRKTINSIETLTSVSENKEEFEKLEARYRQQKESLYASLDIKNKEREKKIKEDFDRKFNALLSIPSLEKDE